jgi:hypothetical protein
VAYFVSNKKPSKNRIKDFLEWVIDQNHIPQLQTFPSIESATTSTFSRRILEATVSMKKTDLLRSLLLSRVDFRPVIQEAIQITDIDFVDLLLSRVDPQCLSRDSGGQLLVRVSETDNIRAASVLVEHGANIDFNPDGQATPLYRAVDRN